MKINIIRLLIFCIIICTSINIVKRVYKDDSLAIAETGNVSILFTTEPHANSNLLKIKNSIFSSTNPTERKNGIIHTLEKINYGNKIVADKVKLKIKNPGTIEGKAQLPTMPAKNVVVYIKEIKDNNFNPVTKRFVPDIIKGVNAKSKTAEFPLMAHINMRFKPHILPVLKGSIVDMPNLDTLKHNVFSPEPIPGTNEKINLGSYDSGLTKTVKVDNRGHLPLLCNVHKEMSAYIVSLDNPYFCLTDKNGQFKIENVPSGRYTIMTWHETYKTSPAQVEVKPGQNVMINLPMVKGKR